MKPKPLALVLRAAVGLCAAAAAAPEAPAYAAKPADDASAVAALAKQRFKEGQFEVAARLYVRAYEMSRRPALLFNAARAREAQGNKDSALRLYRTYLDIEKDVAGREEARVRISVLEEGGARDNTRPPPPSADTDSKNAEIAGKSKTQGRKDEPGKAAAPDRVAADAPGPAGGQIDRLVPFSPGGTHKLGVNVGRLILEEIVLRNMPTAKDLEEARKDPGDKSHPKIAVGLSNPGSVDLDVKVKVSLETASGEVLMSCNTSDSVKPGAHNDHSNLCWIAGLKTLDWPRLARLHLVASVSAKK